ncbi:MAG: RNA polymerase sigma factor [Limisphaerales bacterium]
MEPKPQPGLFPVTAPSFADAVIRGLDEGWQRFACDYTGPAIRFLQALGAGDDAEDLWQAFFLKFLEKERLAEYTIGKGRFRSFLMTCLRNHLRDHYRGERAEKRNVDQTRSLHTPLSGTDGDESSLLDILAAADEAALQRRVMEVRDTIKFLLNDYPVATEAATYREWFWKSKGVSDEEFARAHKLTRNQLNELRKRVEKHLRHRADESER